MAQMTTEELIKTLREFTGAAEGFYTRHERIIFDLAASRLEALSRSGGATPKGWKLVPEEPTVGMLNASFLKEGLSRQPHSEIYRAMLAAAPPPPEPESGWRPIEEAPKDGTVIIVPGGVAHWSDECWKTLTGEQYPGKPIQWHVTLWQPLPAPPSPQPSQEG